MLGVVTFIAVAAAAVSPVDAFVAPRPLAARRYDVQLLQPETAPRRMTRRFGLLKNIDPILTADLLHVLRSAGHGDVIAVVDCNFPAVEVASHTTTKQLVQLAGVTGPEALDAIGSVLPIDFFVEQPLHHMCPSPGIAMPPTGVEVLAEAQAAVGKQCAGAQFVPLDRFAFYDKARSAFAVVQTAERRPYGCFLLQKGVVGPDGKDYIPESA